MAFLHHILNLDEEYPVKVVYFEQKKFELESNWANECATLRKKYNLYYTDQDISSINKDVWTKEVKAQVQKHALSTLNNECHEHTKTSAIPTYIDLKPQNYLYELKAIPNRESNKEVF